MDPKNYPGYANIAFQRARYFVFSCFQSDLAGMTRFATMMDDFLLAEAERRQDTPGQSVAELTGSFVDILLSSMVVAFYGRFESFLFDVCRMVHDNEVHSIDLGSMRSIEDVKNYLEGVPNLEFPGETKAWTDICSLKDLRNVIAHNNRILAVSDRDEKRKSSIETIPHVSINHRREVWLERGLLAHVATSLNAFTTSLEQAFGPSGRVPAPNRGLKRAPGGAA